MRTSLLLGVLALIAFLIFSALQIYAGYVGISHHFGPIWGAAAVVLSVMFKFTLPITVGAFFGALNVWHWPWFLAFLFVAPGLIFVIPGALIIVISVMRRMLRGTPRQNPKDVIIEADYTDHSKKD